MSGWIKLEKDLESDPRVLRMSKAIDKKFQLYPQDVALESCNACAFPGVTLVCGALARLWMYADSHAREDDTLDMGPEEINEWLRIPDFCALIPDDWLRVIDQHTVELPGYQEHNGVEAKKRALTQKRVTQHRNKVKRDSVTPRNASALPDQTKTRPRPRPKPIQSGVDWVGGKDRPPFDPNAIADLNLDAWNQWVAYRAERKPAIRIASLQAAAEELAAFGADQLVVVKKSIASGWQGLFAPKQNGASGLTPGQRRKTTAELEAEEAASNAEH